MKYLVFLFSLVLVVGCSEKEGCMDAASLNFDPDATVSDGSCEFEGTLAFNMSAQLGCSDITIRIDGEVVGTMDESGNNKQIQYEWKTSPGSFNWQVTDQCNDWNGTAEIGSGERVMETLTR